ncbi:aldehyde dehydrogenase family protein, partial [Butyricicoccus sp. 1XD8-22]
ALEQDIEDAIEGAHQTFHNEFKHMPAYKRSKILRKAAEIMEQRKAALAEILTLEVGKPIKDAFGEVGRAIQVLEFSAEEAKRIQGESIPMDAAIGGENRLGIVKKYPLGVVLAITPFNFPVNLALHKIGPAIAAGNTVILKPAEKTPLSSVYLYEIFKEAGLPDGALQIVMGEGIHVVPPLVKSEKVSKVSFTGSYAVGKSIYEMAGLKKVTLELGSNSPNIVLNDADIEESAKSLVKGSFVNAGQVCISVQRIYVQKEIFEE